MQKLEGYNVILILVREVEFLGLYGGFKAGQSIMKTL